MAVASLTLPSLLSPPLIQSTPSSSRHCSSSSIYSTSNNNNNNNIIKSYPSFYVSVPPRKDVLIVAGFNKRTRRRVKAAMSSLNSPLISPQDHWGIWTALFATATFGLWSERTKIGSMISAALVTILLGIAASNLGVIPYEAPAYSVVFQYLLPLTIPLLLFRADMWHVMHSTGTLFIAFLLGSGHILILALLSLSKSCIWSRSLYWKRQTCHT